MIEILKIKIPLGTSMWDSIALINKQIDDAVRPNRRDWKVSFLGIKRHKTFALFMYSAELWGRG